MRLDASLRYALYAAMALLLASGLVWLETSPGPAATWCMRVHGAVTMLVLVLAGMTVALHVADAWRKRKNLVSGLALGCTLLVLAATGCLLYYVGDDATRSVLSPVHWIFGVAATAVLGWHVLAAQRDR